MSTALRTRNSTIATETRLLAQISLSAVIGYTGESTFRRNRYAQSGQPRTQFYLAGQSRALVAMVRSVEQIAFVLAHRRQHSCEIGVHEDMAGGARTHAATQSQQIVEERVTDRFHQCAVFNGLHGPFISGPVGHEYCRHGFPLIGVSGAAPARLRFTPLAEVTRKCNDGKLRMINAKVSF